MVIFMSDNLPVYFNNELLIVFYTFLCYLTFFLSSTC